jgi:putative acetyltransferase
LYQIVTKLFILEIHILPINTVSPLLHSVIQLFQEYQLELGEDLCFQSFDEELKNPLKKYGPPWGLLYAATSNHQVVGCIALQSLPDRSCEMKRLYVKPKYRKHKIGAALVEKLLEQVKQLPYKIMKLDTLERLQPAIKLYEKYGFVHVNAYYENPLPNVVYMEKILY